MAETWIRVNFLRRDDMFSKNKKNQSRSSSSAAATAPVKPSAPSIISADLKINGNLISKGEIQVDGTIRGDISTKKLLVGESADIKGEIVADSIQVHGRIDGQIKARQVVLAKTAHVVGDIFHENLSIEPGAFLEGLCKRISEAELAESTKMNVVQGGSGGQSSGQPAQPAAGIPAVGSAKLASGT